MFVFEFIMFSIFNIPSLLDTYFEKHKFKPKSQFGLKKYLE